MRQTARTRYTHTNLVARDWRGLAAFYENVFGCVAVPPERDLQGEGLEAVLAAGGSRLGEVVTFEVAGAGTITWTYARDPEGNIIELQSWS
jgi:predicted enzyme related to lactoylglutathione lyase